MSNLFFLKQIGHNLLDEYVSLDLCKNKKMIKKKAYEDLGKKIKKEFSAHFGMMTTEKEVLEANKKLRNMILKRRKKMFLIQFAPDLMNLQKQATELNRGLILQ